MLRQIAKLRDDMRPLPRVVLLLDGRVLGAAPLLTLPVSRTVIFELSPDDATIVYAIAQCGVLPCQVKEVPSPPLAPPAPSR